MALIAPKRHRRALNGDCGATPYPVGDHASKHDIFSYIKMHFSYLKSNISRKWLNMLRNYVHARTFFTPKIHLMT